MTGWRLTSLMPAMMRCLSSYFEATRMWRKTERANLEKKPSTRLSQEPCLGVKVNSKRSVAWRRPLGARARNVRQSSNILTAHRQFDRIPPSCHHTNPRPANSKRGIHQQTASSTQAGFMESVV